MIFSLNKRQYLDCKTDHNSQCSLYFQQYLEQWHLLENLQSDLGSESHSRQDSVASLHNSTTSNANNEDAEPADYQQEKVRY